MILLALDWTLMRQRISNIISRKGVTRVAIFLPQSRSIQGLRDRIVQSVNSWADSEPIFTFFAFFIGGSALRHL